MIPDFPKKVEILFWDHAIPELTENQKLQNMVQSCARIRKINPALSPRQFYLLVAFSGMAFGILTYFLTHSA